MLWIVCFLLGIILLVFGWLLFKINKELERIRTLLEQDLQHISELKIVGEILKRKYENYFKGED